MLRFSQKVEVPSASRDTIAPGELHFNIKHVFAYIYRE